MPRTMAPRPLPFVFSLSLFAPSALAAAAFSVCETARRHSAAPSALRSHGPDIGAVDGVIPSGPAPAAGDRRAFLSESATAAAAVVSSANVLPALAADPPASPGGAPYCVIGSNGRTGTETVGALVYRGFAVRATTRSGSYTGLPGRGSDLVTEMPCDVTSPETIVPAVRGAAAVIFAASASKEGGTTAAVDNAGVVRVAEACIAEDVPHLVIVSSGGVTKPSSAIYVFLNLFGKIMEEKIRGEDAVRALYREHNKQVRAGGGKELAYTIIRPGGLTTDPPRGAAALELNQGDTKSGRISRADVAALCVEAVRHPQYTSCATFECYDADTGAPLASVGLSNIMKAKTDDKAFASGRECRGETWEGLFSGLERD